MLKGKKRCAVASWLVSSTPSPDSSPGGGHCVVFLGNKLHSRSASLHPKWVPENVILGVTLRWTSIPSMGARVEIFLVRNRDKLPAGEPLGLYVDFT